MANERKEGSGPPNATHVLDGTDRHNATRRRDTATPRSRNRCRKLHTRRRRDSSARWAPETREPFPRPGRSANDPQTNATSKTNREHEQERPAAPNRQTAISNQRSGGSSMTIFHPTGSCGICGSASVHVDEVFQPERLVLSECARCRHRWTQSPQVARTARSIRLGRVEPAEVALAS